jgi:uncharacterized protein YfaS (alpha-2-macroglobulin family)
MRMKRIVVLILSVVLASLGFAVPTERAAAYEKIKAEAERLVVEKSWARAHELYAAVDRQALPNEEQRWVRFRLADTQWRNEAADQTADQTRFDEARRELAALIAESETTGNRDRIYAEASESLGDSYWLAHRDWSSGLEHYTKALTWWGGSTDLDLARKRYLDIVWRLSREEEYDWGRYASSIPREIVENAVKIARTADDRAHAAYLLALNLRNAGIESHDRTREMFELAISGGRSTQWYDDALFAYAQWLEQRGILTERENGSFVFENDFAGALTVYRRIVSEFKEGESRYFPQAKQRITDISQPALSITATNVFLPGSEIDFGLHSRNVSSVAFRLVAIDLTRDASVKADRSWLDTIDASRGRPVAQWTRKVDGSRPYQPRTERVSIEQKLDPGAYLLLADSGSVRAREILLVSDTSVVMRSSSTQALTWVTDAATGAPIPNARVVLWTRGWRDGASYAASDELQTNSDGLAIFKLRDSSSQLLVFARRDDRQAFAEGWTHGRDRSQPLSWKIYAFTDRPAYRPEETVQWKFVARAKQGESYILPSGETLEYEITDPRGTKVASGSAKLNEFGSFWSSLPLDSSMPLGMYTVTFLNGAKHHVGSAQLFRLEEYKLPEFRVSVETPVVDGRRKAFRLGERVEVKVAATYYFGGPVSNGTVEVVVRQQPFHHWYRPFRDYSWYFEPQQPHYWGGGEIIKRETLPLGADGTATVGFDTPAGAGTDMQYEIEARVVDASRREIVGNGSVRVSRTRYYAHLTPQHYLHRPNEKVTIDVATIDANDQPVSVEGEVTLTRERWREVWLSPDGKEVSGDELARLRERHPSFPPLVDEDKHPWKLKFRGYETDEIFKRTVKTDAEGKASVTFTPDREGFYRLRWTSDDRLDLTKPRRPQELVRAEAMAWVASPSSTSLGYQKGGVEVIVDRDTFKAGETAPVMIVAPTNDRYVLFNVEGNDFLETRVVHLDGTVKLLEIPVTEKHVPNIFLTANLVTGRQLYSDTKEVIVPPVKQFVDVEIKADSDQKEPRQPGKLLLTTRDSEGRPVAAEVAVALVDDSVFSIQSELAGDPRQFFFGERRHRMIQTTSSFTKPYLRRQKESDLKREGKEELFVEDALQETAVMTGGVSAEYGRFNAAAESITVTASAPAMLDSFAKSANPAAPPPAPVPQARGAVAGEPVPEPAVVVVRSDFRSTILWQPNVVTSANGQASIDFTYPDSLTTWKATARAVTTANQFGSGSTTTMTRKPLIVRLQAPRFFVAGDEVTVSAVINNNTGAAMSVAPELTATGLRLLTTSVSPVNVEPDGDARVEWRLSATEAGLATLKVVARGGSHSDAMERQYSVHEHGIEKLVARSGKTRSDQTVVKLDLPAARRAGSTHMVVQVTPSIAVTMLDALPYLVHYPYGCTEQTMSRFLPAVVTARTLHDLGVSREVVASRLFGGVEAASAATTHPDGKHLRELNDVVAKGLARIYDFQHSDGGWGWWKEGESDPYMSAYVVWGLALATEAGIDVRDRVLAAGVAYLQTRLVERETSPDDQSWMLHALAEARKGKAPTAAESQAIENLWNRRDRLRPYGRALFTVALHRFGMRERAVTLSRNLENGAKIDRTPDTSILTGGGRSSEASTIPTAHWGEDGFWWRWMDGPVESTAMALRALAMVDPKHPLVEPAMNWLVKNRRGAQWDNTKDTAITVLALNDYLRTSGELSAGAEYEVTVNGRSIAKQRLAASELLRAPSRFEVPADLLRSGTNEIGISRLSGSAGLYFSVETRFFSLEEPITAAGNEIFVRRDYYRLAGQPTLLEGHRYDRVPLEDGGSIASGERVEVVVRVETKNDYEYLLFEDLKPAGFEAIEVQSGGSLYASELKVSAVDRKTTAGSRPLPSDTQTGRTRLVYRELRDRKVALFIDKLPQGIWEIRYTLRAETPGRFHALPLLGGAMYVPEIRANGEEVRVTLE